MTIQSGDPLGVFNVTQELPQTSYLVVYPPVVDLTSFGAPPSRTWPAARLVTAAPIR
ncbi:MAG: hypothetical protein R2838_18185 [Caldilineaceae bacterium]